VLLWSCLLEVSFKFHCLCELFIQASSASQHVMLTQH
jgi:hypothetical protein